LASNNRYGNTLTLNNRSSPLLSPSDAGLVDDELVDGVDDVDDVGGAIVDTFDEVDDAAVAIQLHKREYFSVLDDQL
jgi:hypothetical protein